MNCIYFYKILVRQNLIVFFFSISYTPVCLLSFTTKFCGTGGVVVVEFSKHLIRFVSV